MLNQTNIGNNNNKFYIIQLLESDDKSKFYFWNRFGCSRNSLKLFFYKANCGCCRWGRVGATGQSKLMGPFVLEQAKTLFVGKFKDKTR